MSDVDESKKKRKSSIAPKSRTGKKPPKPPRDPSVRKKRVSTGQRIPRLLTPIQLRVLDAMHDPRANTKADVAALSGVMESTITRWMIGSAPFIEEYKRRVMYRGDEIGDLNIAAVTLALKFHIGVLSDTKDKYTTEQKFESAKAILTINRPRIDALVQQVNVNQQQASAPPVIEGTTTLASVKRFTDAGMAEPQALQVDATELALVLEQISTGALSERPAVIDGEAYRAE